MGIALSLRTPQLWGLLEASEQHPMSLFSLKHCFLGLCRFNQLRVSIFATFDHQLGRCIPGWWDSLWRSSGGTDGTLGADRCAGCADVGRHPFSWENTPVGLMKKIGYHLVSTKVEWVCTPSYFSDFTADFFFEFCLMTILCTWSPASFYIHFSWKTWRISKYPGMTSAFHLRGFNPSNPRSRCLCCAKSWWVSPLLGWILFWWTLRRHAPRVIPGGEGDGGAAI